MSERIQVAAVSELDPGERKVVEIDNHEIGVFNVNGEYYAMTNRCPHAGGPVCTGKVQGKLVADWPGVGERPVERFDEEPVIACPWHGWEFSLETGKHAGDDRFIVKTYNIIVENGDILIEL